MRFLAALFSNTDQQRWLLHLLGLLLGFALLISSVWLYYDHKVRQLEQRGQELWTPTR